MHAAAWNEQSQRRGAISGMKVPVFPICLLSLPTTVTICVCLFPVCMCSLLPLWLALSCLSLDWIWPLRRHFRDVVMYLAVRRVFLDECANLCVVLICEIPLHVRLILRGRAVHRDSMSTQHGTSHRMEVHALSTTNDGPTKPSNTRHPRKWSMARRLFDHDPKHTQKYTLFDEEWCIWLLCLTESVRNGASWLLL